MKLASFCLASGLLLALPAGPGAEDRLGVGRTIVIGPEQTAGDVICFGCSIRVRGTVQGDLVSFLGGIDIEGTAGGDAVAAGGAIRLRPGARLEGEAVAIGGPVVREASAVLGGEMDAVVWFHLPGQRQFFWRGVVALAGFQFGLLLVLYPVARRRRVENVAGMLSRHPVWTFLAGAGVVALVGVGVTFAADLGRWLGVASNVLSVLLLATGGFGALGIYAWLGRKAKPAGAPFAAAALGALLCLLVELVPLVGFLAFSLLFVLALGSAILSCFGFRAGPGAANPGRRQGADGIRYLMNTQALRRSTVALL